MTELRPIDIPDGGKVEIHVEDGAFVAYVFCDPAARVYDGEGSGPTIGGAVKAALEDME
jgi:hypothetical protein